MADHEEIANLKNLRTKSKRKVTGLIRKLNGNLQYGDEKTSSL